jgi:adenosine deaminase
MMASKIDNFPETALSIEARNELRQKLLNDFDPFISAIPKVELHVHIEGTLTPELRWKLAQRNGMTLKLERTGAIYTSCEQLKASYQLIQARPGHSFDDAEERFTFFEAYYGGFEVLRTEQDFYDLAMNYFEHAAAMNVRYCEPFFDPQGHTRRGVSWEIMMGGFKKAQIDAEKIHSVSSSRKLIKVSLMYVITVEIPVDYVHAPRHVSRICYGALCCRSPISRHDCRNRS